MNKRFKPQYLPYNDDAHALVEALAAELGLTLKNSAGHTKVDASLSSVTRHHLHGGLYQALAF